MLAVTAPGLLLCLTGFVLAPKDELLSPLTIALAACVLVGTRVSLDLEGTLFWDGSFLPIACSVAILGTAPVALITALSELSVFQVERYRLRVLPVNLFGTLAPNMAAAWVMSEAAPTPEGAGFLAFYAVTISGAIVMNSVLITSLAGVLYDEPIVERLRGHARYTPAVAVNVVLALGAVATYRSAGVLATVFVIAGVFVFAYMVRRIHAERAQRAEIEDLASSRGRLVAQLLEAEDRERRALAERLHDSPVQTLITAKQDLQDAEVSDQPSIHGVAAKLDQAVDELRQMIVATHPSVLDRVGLRGALETVVEQTADRSGAHLHLDVSPAAVGKRDRLLFSVARELIANAHKHANAQTVTIRIGITGNVLRLDVADDGIGFDTRTLEGCATIGHIGLASAVERVRAAGGTAEIESSPGSGTQVSVEVPVVGSPVAVRDLRGTQAATA